MNDRKEMDELRAVAILPEIYFIQVSASCEVSLMVLTSSMSITDI